jgi:hypothetical protein
VFARRFAADQPIHLGLVVWVFARLPGLFGILKNACVLCLAPGNGEIDEKIATEDRYDYVGMPMTQTDPTEVKVSAPHNVGGISDFFRRNLLYVFILTLAILGVAYTNISHQPLVGYWELLAVMMGVVCVFTEWTKREDRHDQLQLMWTQALHWIAVLITMNIMLLTGVQRTLAWPATSLVLLMLLALGTFLAGLSLLSLPICFLGVALVLAVPAIAWLKQSALFLVLIAIFLIGLGIILLPGPWRRRASIPNKGELS